MTAKAKILERAQKLFIKGQFDKAVNEYASVIAMDPSDAGTRMKVGDLYLKLARKDDALKQYIEVARLYADKGFYLKAIAVYKQVLRLDPAAEVRLRLADLYARQKLIADAIAEYSVVVAGLEAKGRASEAMELVKKMLVLDQNNLTLRLKVADYYRKSGFRQDALKEYGLAFDMASEQSNADAAERIYREAAVLGGDEPRMLRALSSLFRKKADIARFLSYAGMLANLYRERGENGESRLVAEEILAVKPGDSAATALLDSMGFRPVMTMEGASSHEVGEEAVPADIHAEEVLPEIAIVIEPEEEAPEDLPKAVEETVLQETPEEAEEAEEALDAAGEAVEEPLIAEEPFASEQEETVPEPAAPVVEEPQEPPTLEALPEVKEEEAVPLPPEILETPEEAKEAPDVAHEAVEEPLIAEEPFASEQEEAVPEPALPVVEEPQEPPTLEALPEVKEEEAVPLPPEILETPEEAKEAPDVAHEAVRELLIVEDKEEPSGEVLEEAGAETLVEALAEEEAAPVMPEEPLEPQEPVDEALAAEKTEPPLLEDLEKIVSEGIEHVAEEAMAPEEQGVLEEAMPAPAEAKETLEEVEEAPDVAHEAVEEPLIVEEPFASEQEETVPEPALPVVEEPQEPPTLEALPEVKEEEVFAKEEQEAAPVMPEEPLEPREPVDEALAAEKTEPPLLEDLEKIVSEGIEHVAEEAMAPEEQEALPLPLTEDTDKTGEGQGAFEPMVWPEAHAEVFPPDVEAHDKEPVIEAAALLEEAPIPEAVRVEGPLSIVEEHEVPLHAQEPFASEAAEPETRGPAQAGDEAESRPLAEPLLPEALEMEPPLLPEAAEIEAPLSQEPLIAPEHAPLLEEHAGGMEEPAQADVSQMRLIEEDPRTHYKLGLEYMDMGLYDFAIGEFKEAIKNPLLEFDCYTMLGHASMAISRPRDAVEYYLKALKAREHAPDDRKSVMYNVASAYEAQDLFSKAQDMYRSVYEIDPMYRGVAMKIGGEGRMMSMGIPLDDAVIEIELL